MTKKAKVKIAIDFLMTILLPLLMAYSLVGEVAHEWLGITMFALFIGHHILNFGWIKSLLKGKYTLIRTLQTLVNVMLFICMVGLMYSGIVLSNEIFAFLPISTGINVARITHLLASYWGFALMCLHLGFHLNMFMKIAQKITKNNFRLELL